MKRASNSKCWAIGVQRRNGFHVRRIVWGLLMAQAERGPSEEIRAASISVESVLKKRKSVLGRSAVLFTIDNTVTDVKSVRP